MPTSRILLRKGVGSLAFERRANGVADNHWLTIPESCLVAKCSAKLLYREIKLGRLRAARTNGRRGSIRIRHDWIDEWLQASAGLVEVTTLRRRL